MPARRLVTEIMIEGEHAVDFGARQIQGRCDHGNRGLRHIAEGFLQCVQDHQRRTFKASMFGDDLGAVGGIPGFVSWHHRPSLSEAYYQPMRTGIDPDINKAVSCCNTESRSIEI